MNLHARKPPRNFIADPFEYHQEIDLTIDTLTNLGQGLGRLDGWVVMVPYSIPGEKIRARIHRNHKNYSEADLIEVLESSSQRVEPRCSLFGECGGCQYQHMNQEAQAEWKHRQVTELLEKSLGEKLSIEPIHSSPRQFNYRSKITPHHQRPRDGKVRSIGFLHHGQRNWIVDVPHCPIATEAINEALPPARDVVQQKAATGKIKKGATLLFRDTGSAVVTDFQELVFTQVGELSFQFKAGDFFQNTLFILEAFTEYTVRQAAGGNSRFLIDAYCGGGLFTLFGSRHFEKCAGVEINEYSVVLARANANANQINNCSFLQSSAEAIFGDVEFSPKETTVLLDPPRKGCDKEFIDQLIAFKPIRIVYVSCDPSTQARDLVPLRDAGYHILRVQPFDLFPQTRHIENVVTLELSASDSVA